MDPQPPTAAARTSRRSTSCASSTTRSTRSTRTSPRSPRSRRRGRWSPAPPPTAASASAYKWDMGWMHDTLQYVRRDPVHRRFHHDEITFRSVYTFTEHYVLPLSHDEVVHGKGSLIGKMPGDDWQRFANLRLLFGMMWAQPGKKLLFMGGELGDVVGVEPRRHARLGAARRAVAQPACGCGWPTSTQLYRDEPALAAGDADPAGFRWIMATTTPTACSPGCASIRPAPRRRCWSSSTPRRPSTTATASACPTGGRWVELLNSDADDLRRQRHGQPRRRRRRGPPVARLRALAAADHPAAGVVLLRPATDPRSVSPHRVRRGLVR